MSLIQSGDIDLAVGADAAEVAAAQPAVVERAGPMPRIGVAGEDLGTARDDLSGRRGAAMQFAPGEHGDFDERDGKADGAGLLSEIVGRLGDRAGEFGHSIDLSDAVARPCGEKAPLDLRRANRSAGGEQAQARNIGPVDRDLGDRSERCRN
jgi:hypothetical protein